MKTKFLLLFLLLSSFSIAQDIKFSTKDNDLKLAALPYYNYGKGLGITSPDSLFQLNIRFRMQNRVTYFENEGEDPAYSGEIRRLRLRFDGYVGSPKFLYALQLSFAPGDVGEIQEGENLPLKQIRNELEDYFKHPFASFKTPVEFIGTDFQKQVWEELRTIPSGGTSTYSEIAEKINNENAARAVANALNANKLAIIVPCHRVLTKDLEFGGYNAGANRKSWLLQHEGI